MSTASELAKQEVETKKKLNRYKWRNRFMFLAFSILGFLVVSITSIFFPDSWAPIIKSLVQVWGVPAVALYAIPAIVFLLAAYTKEERDETLHAVARVFGSLAIMAGIMSVFSYILASGMLGTAGEWLWSNPMFVMMSGWLIFFDIVFFIFLSWEVLPKQWTWIFEHLGYKAYPPPPHEDRIFHKLRVYMSYEFKQELLTELAKLDKTPPAVAPAEELPTSVIFEETEIHDIPDDVIRTLTEADKEIESAKTGGE